MITHICLFFKKRKVFKIFLTFSILFIAVEKFLLYNAYNDEKGDFVNVFEDITVSEIDSVAIIDNTKGMGRTIKNRFAYAVSFCLSGKITYHYDGKDYVSDCEHVIFLPKGKSYTITCQESGHFPLINFYCSKDISDFGIVSAKISNAEYCTNAFNKLLKNFSFPERAKTVHCLSVFYDILSEVSNDIEKSKNVAVLPAIKYIEEHFSDSELNNAQLAGCCRVSEVYFRRLFTGIYGVSPHKYIQNFRIKRAKDLLTSSNMSIIKISEVCGYTSVYHFCRAFKSSVGETPTNYRRNSASLFY